MCLFLLKIELQIGAKWRKRPEIIIIIVIEQFNKYILGEQITKDEAGTAVVL